MEILRLTTTGEQAAKSIKNDGSPRRKIVYYLAKVHRSTRENILKNIPDATMGDIAVLRSKGVVEADSEVM